MAKTRTAFIPNPPRKGKVPKAAKPPKGNGKKHEKMEKQRKKEY